MISILPIEPEHAEVDWKHCESEHAISVVSDIDARLYKHQDEKDEARRDEVLVEIGETAIGVLDFPAVELLTEFLSQSNDVSCLADGRETEF